MRILIDTNVVLDFLQEREPFVEDAAKLFAKIDAGEIEGFIAATTITNIYYIVRKAAGAIAVQGMNLK
ncbi:type II toxin-antitoxin system VapC family toxin [Nostoc sp.]